MYGYDLKEDLKDLLLNDLERFKNEIFAKQIARVLNICKNGYGKSDLLWGLRVPCQRNIVKKYWKDINLNDVKELLRHKVHEVRFTSLMILVEKYKKADNNGKLYIYKIYLENIEYINNWDLVDSSAPYIPGHYWYNNFLIDFWKYAKSGNLWKERVAMVSTMYFIRQGRFSETLELAKLFLTHKHHLIHKASGWMLREIGKRNVRILISFLDKYFTIMPRTCLRYSIERLSYEQKKYYLEK
ncbi:MAG: DNA alkylation repair protein [Endomicrobium sp.]|jgi:3-methyladenine DNA glycosylase AlkD|nr:DNA alkylation repair protein [Endomicrobium sp.]